VRMSERSEAASAARGVRILKTCTPYLAGNVPKQGEHCAWMESSAVVYCNSVLGARTNTEGRESTSAAMLTGKIPDWGFHIDEFRLATHHIQVEVDVASVMDWGMLGYFIGAAVEDEPVPAGNSGGPPGQRIPVVTGRFSRPDLIRHKHFGAAAASSGGVEMYHLEGVTPEAPTLQRALGSKTPVAIIPYGKAEQRRTYDELNARASDPNVDFVMLGCPHAALEQFREIASLLEGRRISENCRLWVFTSRAVKAEADASGYAAVIRAAGGAVLTDTCSSIAQAVPPGTKVVALDSAKQTHYLPAIMGVQAWFGTTADCINAALTGRWDGRRP
jgi:predicted aconitase